jgi:hypothetical protein
MSRFLFRRRRVRRGRRYRAGQRSPLLESAGIALRGRRRTPFPAARDDRSVALWVVATLLAFVFMFTAVFAIVLAVMFAFMLVLVIILAWRLRHGTASKLAVDPLVNAFGKWPRFFEYYPAYAGARFTK